MENNEKYYEKFLNIQHPNKYVKNKIKIIIENIPKNISSIIDIGCGDGTITNVLGKFFDVLGVERNPKAIEYVKTNKLISSCDNIDLPDNSFDMVFSSEVLEHLPSEVLMNCIKEMKRITKRYIFLTVPNQEVVKKDYIKCPACNRIFNRTYHLRSINLDTISNYFKNYNIIKYFTYGSPKRGYNKFLLNIKHRFVNPKSWIPPYWTKNSNRKTMCPDCEKVFHYKYSFSLFGTILDIFNMLLSPHKPYWLFILLKEKKC